MNFSDGLGMASVYEKGITPIKRDMDMAKDLNEIAFSLRRNGHSDWDPQFHDDASSDHDDDDDEEDEGDEDEDEDHEDDGGDEDDDVDEDGDDSSADDDGDNDDYDTDEEN